MSDEQLVRINRSEVLNLLEQINRLNNQNADLRERLKQMRLMVNEMADRSGRSEYKTTLFDDFMKMMRKHHRIYSTKKEANA